MPLGLPPVLITVSICPAARLGYWEVGLDWPNIIPPRKLEDLDSLCKV
jgi:hypothetical protein